MPCPQRLKVSACVYDLFLVWSRVRLHEGNPVSITRMLTTASYRESFLRSCIETLGLEWKGDLGRRSLENHILQELVGDRILVLPEDQS